MVIGGDIRRREKYSRISFDSQSITDEKVFLFFLLLMGKNKTVGDKQRLWSEVTIQKNDMSE